MKQATCAVAAGLLIAACGSTSSSSNKPAAAASTPSAASTPKATSSGAATDVVVKHDKKLGMILAAGPKHLTVYLFEGDSGSKSGCSGACAKAWPPVIASGAPQAMSGAQSSLVGTTTRADGTKQVTYAGHPLYYFIKDKDDGDAYGEGAKAFGSSWYALKPSGAKLDLS